MTHYYCAIVSFARGLQVNLWSDNDVVCVAIALATRLKKKHKIHLWTKEWYRITPKHTRKYYDRLQAEWTKRLQNFWGWMAHHSLLLPYYRQKRFTQQAVTLSQRVPLRRAIWPLDMLLHLEFENAISHYPIGMTVLEAYLLLGRQTGNESIFRPQYCLQTIQ